MALSRPLSFRGLTALNSYTRVSYIGIDRDASRVVFQLVTHADVAARDANAEPLSSEPLTITNTKDNAEFDAFMSLSKALPPDAAAYTLLKARDEWKDATDVEHTVKPDAPAVLESRRPDPAEAFMPGSYHETASDLRAADERPRAAPVADPAGAAGTGRPGFLRSLGGRIKRLFGQG